MHTAPSSHWYIVVTRWVGLIVSALLLVVQQRPPVYWWVWLVALAYTLVLSAFAQPLVRWVLRVPTSLALDVTVGVVLVANTGGWTSPLYPVFLSLFVMPALLFGRSGGISAGCAAGFGLAGVVWLGGQWELGGDSIFLQRGVLLVLPGFVGYAAAVVYAGNAAARVVPQRGTPEAPLAAPWFDVLVQRAVPRFDGGRLLRRGDGQTAVQHRVEELRVALYAPTPAATGILDQIQRITDTFEATAHIAVRYVVLGRQKPIPAAHHDTMRRLVIEALLNVEQHTEAQSVSVLVRFDTRTVTVLVQDDGCGLPGSGIYRAGMHSMQMLVYRVSEVGGRLEVFTPSSGGVAVRAVYPLHGDELII